MRCEVAHVEDAGPAALGDARACERLLAEQQAAKCGEAVGGHDGMVQGDGNGFVSAGRFARDGGMKS